MSKKLIYALVMIGLVVVLLLANTGRASLNVGFADFSIDKALLLFGFTGIGVVIGILLK